MSLASPTMLWLLLPVLLLPAWQLSGYRFGVARLPGSWGRLIEPALQSFMADYVAGGARPPLLLLTAIWVLLVLALARPGIDQDDAPDFGNLAGRVIVLDLGAGADIHHQRLTVRRLLDGAPTIPTAIMAATGESFVVVPLTVDREHVERYLQVLHADLMPVSGRALQLAAAHAESVLNRADIIAAQVVLVSAGRPPASADVTTPRWPWALVIDQAVAAPAASGENDVLPAWRDYAEKTDALLTDVDDLDAVQRALQQAVTHASRQSGQAARLDLSPWPIGAALLFWLALCRRRQAQTT